MLDQSAKEQSEYFENEKSIFIKKVAALEEQVSNKTQLIIKKDALV
jgi:hypothetical protein